MTYPHPPIQEEIDRAVAELVDERGARKAIAAHAHKSAQLITRWLNPEDHEAPSPIASVLNLLFAANQYSEDLESRFWALLVRERRRFKGPSGNSTQDFIEGLIGKVSRANKTSETIIRAVANGKISAKERAALLDCLLRERSAIERLEMELRGGTGDE